jgi:hypothetical protein
VLQIICHDHLGGAALTSILRIPQDVFSPRIQTLAPSKGSRRRRRLRRR